MIYLIASKDYNFLKSLVLVLVVFFASCSDQEKGASVQPVDLDFIVIGKGTLQGAGQEGVEEANLVITNDADWQMLISQMNMVNNVTEGFTQTAIDFDESMVIAVFLEVKPSGWEVAISMIVQSDDTLTVSTTEEIFAVAALTQPFHIVMIPTTSKEIVFE